MFTIESQNKNILLTIEFDTSESVDIFFCYLPLKNVDSINQF